MSVRTFRPVMEESYDGDGDDAAVREGTADDRPDGRRATPALSSGNRAATTRLYRARARKRLGASKVGGRDPREPVAPTADGPAEATRARKRLAPVRFRTKIRRSDRAYRRLAPTCDITSPRTRRHVAGRSRVREQSVRASANSRPYLEILGLRILSRLGEVPTCHKLHNT